MNTKSLIFLLLLVGFCIFSPSKALAANRYWVGANEASYNSTSNWSATLSSACGANTGASVPASGDVAIFESTCTNNATIDSDWNLGGVKILGGYTGVITQNSGIAFTVGSSDYLQSDGTFHGGNGNITINGNFSVDYGNFISTSGNMTVTGDLNNVSNFTHNSGTVTLTSSSQSIIDFGASSLYNLVLNNASGVWSLSSDLTIANNLTVTAGTLTGAGNLTVNGGNITGDGTIALNGSSTYAYGLKQIDSDVCSLNSSGNVYCWGNGSFGQLGNGTTTTSSTPVRVLAGQAISPDSDGTYLTNIRYIVGGSGYSCAISYSGKTYCWGLATSGQLGDGQTTTNRTTPVLVLKGAATGTDTDGTYLTNLRTISAGASHVCAISYSGKTYCWGTATNGRLGDGQTTTNRTTPVLVLKGAATGVDTDGTYLTNMRDITAQSLHTCAVAFSGYTYCWGGAANGKIGDNQTTTDRTTPVKVLKGLATGADTDGTYLINLKYITNYPTMINNCAISYSGKTYCWGRGVNGFNGDGTGSDRATPILVVKGVATGADTDGTYLTNMKKIDSGFGTSCAISSTNRLYCWGFYGNANTMPYINSSSNNVQSPILGVAPKESSLSSDSNGPVSLSQDNDGTYMTNIKYIKYNGTSGFSIITTSGVLYVVSGFVAQVKNTLGDFEPHNLTLSGSGSLGGNTGYTFVNANFNGNTTATGNGAITLSGSLTVGAGNSLNLGAKSWILGAGITNNGSINSSTSTVSLTSGTTASIGGTNGINFNNFSFSGIGSTKSITFGHGLVYTFSGSTTLSGAPGQSITINSDDGVHQWLAHFNSSISGTALNISNSGCDSGTSNVSLDSNSYVGLNNSNCWNQSGVTITGTIYSDQGSTPYDCSSSNLIISVVTNYTFQKNVTCDSANGSYSIANVPVSAGDTIHVFIDNATGSNRGSVVTRALNNSSNLNLDIYQQHLVIRTENGASLTNTDLSKYDADNNSNIIFTCNNSSLNLSYGKLLVYAGKNFTPGGLVSLSPSSTKDSVDGDVEIQAGANLDMGANTLSIGGDFLNSGTYSYASKQLTVFTGIGSGYSITPGFGNFYDLIFNGSGSWVLPATFTIDHDFKLINGAVTAPSTNLNVGGNFINSSTFTHNSGTVTLTSSSQSIIDFGASSLYNLVLNNASGVWSLSSDLTIANNLTVTAGTLTGAGNLTVNGGNITGDGTIALNGSSTYAYGLKQVSSNLTNTCAVTNSGKAYCWGAAASGQLGDGQTATTRTTPVQVLAGAAVAPDTDGSHLINVKSIVAGKLSACALSYAGNVYCWGTAANGRLGNGTTTPDVSVPVRVLAGAATGADTDGTYLKNIKDISSGGAHMCAVSNSSQTYCWGSANANGLLGNGSASDSSIPVKVLKGESTGVDNDGTYLVNIKKISIGSNMGCALSNAGRTYCWGRQWFGELGKGVSSFSTAVSSSSSTPIQVVKGVATGADTDGTNLINLRTIAPGSVLTVTGNTATCGISYSDNVYCWGSNVAGEVGNGSSVSTAMPVKVLAGAATGADTDGTYLKNIKDISSGEQHVCVTSYAGNVYCWGAAASGQLGDGQTASNRSTPVKVLAGAATGADTDGTYLKNIRTLSLGANHTCAIANSGKAYCWGAAASGQLGDGQTASNRSTPVLVLIGALSENFNATIGGNGNFGGSGSSNYFNLTFNGITTGVGIGSSTVSNTLTINNSTSLDGGTHTFILSNTGTPFTVNGTFIASNSTINYTGTTANISNVSYNNLLLGAGTYTAPATNLYLSGNFTNGGTFNNNSGTLIVNGSGISVLSGATTFNNFTSTSNGKILHFIAGQTFRINGSLVLNGVTLDSTTNSPWFINSQGLASVDNATIGNSGCDVASQPITVTNGINNGNNGTCWVVYSVPSQPLDLSVTSGDTQNVLNWTAPLTDGGSNVVAYKIYRSLASPADTLLTTLGNVLNFIDTGLTNGTNYFYRVSAVNSTGESAKSSEVFGKPAITPSAPQNLVVMGDNNQASLSWSTPSSDGGLAITSYKIYRDTVSPASILLTSVSATNYIDNSVLNNTTYYYRVTAINAKGESVYSDEQSIVPNISSKVTLSDGINPLDAALAPGSNATEIDSFILSTNTDTDSVTGLTVTLSSGSHDSIADIRITGDDGTVTYFSPVNNPSSDVINFTGGTPILVDTNPVQYKIKITPKSHIDMPAIPGGVYNISGTVTSFSSTHLQLGSDDASAILTIDNQSPDNPVWGSNLAKDSKVELAWSNPTDIDFDSVIILRSDSGISDAPTEGVNYSSGENIGSSKVVYVGSDTSSTDSNVINENTYYYKIFALDSSGNYSTGIQSIETPTTLPITTLSDSGDPANNVVAPGVTNQEVDYFNFSTNIATDTINSLVVTTSNTSIIDSVSVYSLDSNTQYFNTETVPTGNNWIFSSGAPIVVTTNPVSYKILINIKPFNEISQGTYALSAYVSDFTGNNFKSGVDNASTNISVDHLASANTTNNVVTDNTPEVKISWLNPLDSDFFGILVLRNTSVISDIPEDGVTYNVGDSVGTSKVVCVLSTTNCTDNSFIVNAILNFYKIFSVDTNGNYSNGIEPSWVNRSSAPQSLSTIAGDSFVNLSWSQPNSDGGSLITGYKIYRDTSTAPTTLIDTLGNVLTYHDTGLTNGTTYYYRISAVNSIGDSEYSNEVSATPVAVISSIDGTTHDVPLTSLTSGQADLPTGATSIVLADSTVLDFSSSKISQTSTDVNIGGNTVALTQAVTLQSGVNDEPVVLTNANLNDVSVSVPDDTKIQGPTAWDGKITPPVAGIPSGKAPAGFKVGNTVISIGSSLGTLVFDKPVTILLENVSGPVGYKPSGSNNWIKITDTCGGDYGNPSLPTYPGECFITDGVNTKIVTYHFTTFGALVVHSVSVGGGSGSRPMPVVSNTVAATTPVVSTPVVVPTTTQGEPVKNISRLLSYGISGPDVKDIQKYLNTHEFPLVTSTASPIGEAGSLGYETEYFGPKTRGAVVRFQNAHGIHADGIVGPETRKIFGF